jgi:multiple antibiotic resistance protein
MLEQLLKFFVVFLVVVDPVSLIPVFAGLTSDASRGYQRKMACKSAVIALAICVAFALVGAKFLEVMGISLNAFRIAGGTLLFLIALEMVFGRPEATRATKSAPQEAHAREDVSVFPLAFPFIAGPGSLAIILLSAGEAHERIRRDRRERGQPSVGRGLGGARGAVHRRWHPRQFSLRLKAAPAADHVTRFA